jgi:putative ABC transport system substrate-binding protein
MALQRATRTIPVVFVNVSDPIGSGFVESLARPGGNITGTSAQTPDLAGKRVELLREVVPGLRRLAIMANVSNPGSVLEMGEAQAAARKLGLDVTAQVSSWHYAA